MSTSPQGQDKPRERKEPPALRKYLLAQELAANVPYIVMTLLGAAVFVVSLAGSPAGWLAAGLYIVYGVVGALWIIVFLCPYCHYWGTRGCPCGYGRIAGKFTTKKDATRFREKFKRHIPVIVGLWFIPVIAGVPLLIRSFSLLLLVLLAAFAVDAFVILPLFSTKHGCAKCPQRDNCPWMGNRNKAGSKNS